MTEFDRVVHEPARLFVVGLLNGAKEADFQRLLRESGPTRSALSSLLAEAGGRR